MSQSSELSINAPDQDYISKKVAIALLEKTLKDEQIDETVTKKILQQFIKNMEDSFKDSDNIHKVPVTFPETSHPSDIRLMRENIDLMRMRMKCVPPHDCEGRPSSGTVIE